jgi:hypothetical protein
VTLTLRFDPRGDSTAWAWVDDVHLTGVPLDAGVSLTGETGLVQAGESVTIEAPLSNRRAGDLELPLEATWPSGWALGEVSVQPDEIGDGLAQFSAPVEQGETALVQMTSGIPADTPRSAQTVTAQLLAPEMDYDYTPDDNEARLHLVVDGLLLWLPLVRH